MTVNYGDWERDFDEREFEEKDSNMPIARVSHPHAGKISASLGPRQRKDAQIKRQKNTGAKQKIYYSGMFCGSHYELNAVDVTIIAVDLDGTLAKLFEPYDPRRIGMPLGQDNPRSAFNQVKRFIKQGKKVVVLTARLNSREHTPEQIKYTHKLIAAWTKKYLGKALPSTSEKHHMMKVMYDDRAIPVNPKTGQIAR